MKDSLKIFTTSKDSFPKFPTTYRKETFSITEKNFSLGSPTKKYVRKERALISVRNMRRTYINCIGKTQISVMLKTAIPTRTYIE
jgi:hypothetical protein